MSEPVSREAAVRRVVLLILVLNVLVAAAKGIYGVISGSLAISSDALHSTLDASSNVVGMIALRFAARPPDADHPYGHHKVEIVAAALIGLMIGGVALEVGITAVRALLAGRSGPQLGLEGFAVMVGTLAVNIFVAAWERSQGKRLESPFLIADAAHTASDVAVTVGVIGAMVLTRSGLGWADPVASLLVILVIGRVGWKILSANVDVLIDRAAVDAEMVRRVAQSVPGVRGCHRVRSRGVEGAAQLDLHITVDGDLPVREAHAISHAVEERLAKELRGLRDVTVHVEPDGDPEEKL